VKDKRKEGKVRTIKGGRKERTNEGMKEAIVDGNA
jgi:hypothetical protein